MSTTTPETSSKIQISPELAKSVLALHEFRVQQQEELLKRNEALWDSIHAAYPELDPKVQYVLRGNTDEPDKVYVVDSSTE